MKRRDLLQSPWTLYEFEISAKLDPTLATPEVEAVWNALPLFIRRGMPQETKVQVRLSLGRWLALGLEFALAADILRTAVAPSWRDIGQLAAIAVLRTGLNYGLEREIAREERRDFTCAARASSD